MSEIIGENTIEKFFDKIYNKYMPTTLFERDLIAINNLHSKSVNIPKNKMYDIVCDRLEIHDFEIDEVSICLLSYICRKPPDVTIYLWYIQYLCNKFGFYDINFNNLLDLFINGFFSDEQLDEIWLAQKTEKGRNLLDIVSAGNSLLTQTPKNIK